MNTKLLQTSQAVSNTVFEHLYTVVINARKIRPMEWVQVDSWWGWYRIM